MTTCRAVFYHLTRSGLEETLTVILNRALQAGWPVMVRGRVPQRMADLDTRLWVAAGEEGFLPHGLQGGPFDEDQPILLGCGALPAAARGLVLVEGADTAPEEVAGLERVWVLFDGSDAAQLAGARGLWTRLTGGGMAAQYWSEDSGRWALKLEKEAAPAR